MRVTRVLVVQMTLLGIVAALIGYEVVSKWGTDDSNSTLLTVGFVICLVAAFVGVFQAKKA